MCQRARLSVCPWNFSFCLSQTAPVTASLLLLTFIRVVSWIFLHFCFWDLLVTILRRVIRAASSAFFDSPFSFSSLIHDFLFWWYLVAAQSRRKTLWWDIEVCLVSIQLTVNGFPLPHRCGLDQQRRLDLFWCLKGCSSQSIVRNNCIWLLIIGIKIVEDHFQGEFFAFTSKRQSAFWAFRCEAQAKRMATRS